MYYISHSRTHIRSQIRRAEICPFSATVGLEAIQTIVKRCTTWMEGLYPWQLPLIAGTLDGDDYLCITATGDGKSALFAIPIIILLEYNRNPELYPQGLRTRANPLSVVITPTKGLASSFVHQLKRDFGLSVLSYASETIGAAQCEGKNLVSMIKECKEWQVICVDPEHLTGRDWRNITDSNTFVKNLVSGTVDETHLILEWGRDFRTAYCLIGKFMRGRFPSHASISGLTATLLPGPSTTDVCRSLGLYRDQFTLVRHSNERKKHATRNSPSYQGIVWILIPRSSSISQSKSEDIYLLRCLEHSPHGFSIIRPYHALLAAKFNQETIAVMENDPRFMIIVSTVALSLGINVKTVVDNIGIDIPKTPEGWVQEKGRASRNQSLLARGISFISKNTIAAARKVVANPSTQPDIHTPSRLGPGRRNNAGGMDIHRAQLIVDSCTESACLTARQNIVFQNPPLDISQLDCIMAQRKVYCFNCAKRAGVTYTFPPSPQPAGSPSLPLFINPEEASKRKKLSKANAARLHEELVIFAKHVCVMERDKSCFWYLPDDAHFPAELIQEIIDNFLIICSASGSLQPYIKSWLHAATYSSKLIDIILKFYITIGSEKKKRSK
ncbi:hypothetical protein D9758_008122 [Tetrapyrgos nigripes]|uniref:DNA 3'-5' helicase n=1 Tax=Tetrapyrgos nigripes TaxID=182062 RepID=A0A8H5GHI8_9AGAR|nr:hypothetical protein D9758_008122 [Tetrapyrgos nigripes]